MNTRNSILRLEDGTEDRPVRKSEGAVATTTEALRARTRKCPFWQLAVSSKLSLALWLTFRPITRKN